MSRINNSSRLFIQMVDTLDFSKYKRFFSFGCSFTDYHWMTWSDIISEEISDSYKYAKTGAGNFYIFQAFSEASLKHKINKNDLVMIMFSNVTREDRFTKKRGWITPGNLYYQDEYDKDFVNKFLCHHGYLMRDLNLVHALSMMLDSIGCDYVFMSMVPFQSQQSDHQLMTDVKYLEKFYSQTLLKIRPSVFETIFNSDWNSIKERPSYFVPWQKNKFIDNHPTPAEHLKYLKHIFPKIKFNEATLKKVQEESLRCLGNSFNPSDFESHKKSCYPRLGEDSIYE
jgi:hypothetical protein